MLRTLNRVIHKTAALHSVSEPTQRICQSTYKMYLFNETRRKLNIKVKHRRILQESGFIEICPAAKIVNVMREFTFFHNPVSEDIVSNTHFKFPSIYIQ
jgi:hypothetical protein